MSGGIALGRLKSERKQWRKDHPFGFWARPQRKKDGSTNLLAWDCGIPGKKGTAWEGGVYLLQLTFSSDYPTNPPTCTFKPKIYHPNVFGSGAVCLSLLKPNYKFGWKPSITIPQILTAIQSLLTEPNLADPANSSASALAKRDKKAYEKKIREQAQSFDPSSSSSVL